MKLKRNINRGYKLLELVILKTKNIITKVQAKESLRFILNILFYYHFTNKKILFIGNFNFFFYQKVYLFFTNTKHSFLPNKFFIKGFFLNKSSMFKYIKIKKLTKSLPNFILALNACDFKLHANELAKFKVPYAKVNWNFNKKNANFFSQKYNTLFFLLLYSMFNKLK